MNNEYEYEWHLGGFSSNNEKLLDECATLFSTHYGKWSTASPYKPGEHIRLSKTRIRERLKNPNSAVYMARCNGELIGYAIAIRLNIPNYGNVSWVTQLVVHIDYRNKNIAKNILHSIWGYSDDFAWGLVSAGPYAVRALEKATRRRCDPLRIKKDIDKILIAGIDLVPYIHKNMERLVDNHTSMINTEFFADHSDIDSMLDSVTSEDVVWKLGQLKEGWEWLAFTFRDQPQISLTKLEIEKMLQASDHIVRDAYGRMVMSDHQSWATHTNNEIQFIINECHLQPNDTVIDFGCGNGRHAIGLARTGRRVKAVDYSPQRIEEAKQHLSQSDLSEKDLVEFILGDCRTINFEPAKAIICLYDVIGSYVDNTDNMKILTNMFQHLVSGGTALISVMNYTLTEAQAKNWFILSENPDQLLELPPSRTMEQTGNVFNPDYYMIDKETKIVYRKEQFQFDKNQLPKELIVRDRRFTQDEITKMCRKVGFEIQFVRYINAKDWNTNLLPAYSSAKEILIKCRKK
jgi:2-polyprenyl-3-methyl-5-hydroxy-6-metoxy-1,4-benzoquinol methylase